MQEKLARAFLGAYFVVWANQSHIADPFTPKPTMEEP
jgi:hypothetical protein